MTPTLLQRANQWLLENPVGHGDSIRQRNASLLVTELRDELEALLASGERPKEDVMQAELDPPLIVGDNGPAYNFAALLSFVLNGIRRHGSVTISEATGDREPPKEEKVSDCICMLIASGDDKSLCPVHGTAAKAAQKAAAGRPAPVSPELREQVLKLQRWMYREHYHHDGVESGLYPTPNGNLVEIDQVLALLDAGVGAEKETLDGGRLLNGVPQGPYAGDSTSTPSTSVRSGGGESV